MWPILDCQQEKFWLTDTKRVFGDKVRSEIFWKDIDAGVKVAILSEQRQ